MFRENSIKTYILYSVKQISSPGWMHETSARAWCTGKAQRDGMGKEVGGVFRSGWLKHVNPWLIHVHVWQKPLQYCKVISLQLIKIKGKKNPWIVSNYNPGDIFPCSFFPSLESHRSKYLCYVCDFLKMFSHRGSLDARLHIGYCKTTTL